MPKLKLLFLLLFAGTAFGQANPVPNYPQTYVFTKPLTAPAFNPQSLAAGPYVNFFDDLLESTSSTFSVTAINGGSSAASACAPYQAAIDANHPGETGIQTGATSTEGSSCMLNNNGWQHLYKPTAGSAPFLLETAINIPTLPGTTAAAFQFGLASTPAVALWLTSDGAFDLSSANANPNNLYCEYGTSPTLTDSTITLTAGTWYRLDVIGDGTNVHWYINGTQVCGTGVAYASTPQSSQEIAYTATAEVSSANTHMIVDYILFQEAVTR